jgi:hypothetical protein
MPRVNEQCMSHNQLVLECFLLPQQTQQPEQIAASAMALNYKKNYALSNLNYWTIELILLDARPQVSNGWHGGSLQASLITSSNPHVTEQLTGACLLVKYALMYVIVIC